MAFNSDQNITADGHVNAVRFPVPQPGSAQDFAQIIAEASRTLGVGPQCVSGAVLSSVKPELTGFLREAVRELCPAEPLLVGPDIRMDIDLSRYNTALIGSDRIAVCQAAHSLYGSPALVCDFGTATTLNVLDGGGHFLGGSIMPGLSMGLNALARGTALLPETHALSGAGLIGRDTKACLISGAVFGSAAMLDGMAQRVQALLGQDIIVLATGGGAPDVIPHCGLPVIHQPELLLKGLFLLFGLNN